MIKDIKVILILAGILGAGVLGAWLYIQSLKSTIETQQNTINRMVQEALDKQVQFDLDTAILQNKHDSLETLNTGLTALGERTVTVTEYVQTYRDNPVNNTPCLRSEWMHTYNRAVKAATDGISRP